jgi:methyl coenzyme M reductase subunit C-like uncharacterized protein (methanogenesis marker protein 7)
MIKHHTPEPWICNENEYDDYIWGSNREMIAESRGTGAGLPQEANRRRIVACVNACNGLPNELLEAEGYTIKVAIEEFIRRIREVELENKELRRMLLRNQGLIK